MQGISTEFKLSCFTSSRPIHGWWRYVHIAEHLFVSLRWEMAERSKPSRGLTSLWMTSIASVFRRCRRKLRWAAFSIPDRCGQIAQKHEIFPFHDVGEKESRRENPPSSGSVHRDTDKIRSTMLPIRSIRFSPLSCHFFSWTAIFLLFYIIRQFGETRVTSQSFRDIFLIKLTKLTYNSSPVYIQENSIILFAPLCWFQEAICDYFQCDRFNYEWKFVLKKCAFKKRIF